MLMPAAIQPRLPLASGLPCRRPHVCSGHTWLRSAPFPGGRNRVVLGRVLSPKVTWELLATETCRLSFGSITV